MVVVAALQLLIINRLTLGPQWLAPTVELTLLAPLSIATAWTQVKARDGTTDHHWYRIARVRRGKRTLAIILTALITLMIFGALKLLVKALLSGQTGASGQTLLLDAVNIWATNVIAFALWFWSMDRGGPAARGISVRVVDDFLFPQMTIDATGSQGLRIISMSHSQTQRLFHRPTPCRSLGAQSSS